MNVWATLRKDDQVFVFLVFCEICRVTTQILFVCSLSACQESSQFRITSFRVRFASEQKPPQSLHASFFVLI